MVIRSLFRLKFPSNLFILNRAGEQGELQIMVVIRAVHALAVFTNRHMNLVSSLFLSAGNIRQSKLPPVFVFPICCRCVGASLPQGCPMFDVYAVFNGAGTGACPYDDL